jgi:hypothetical protein
MANVDDPISSKTEPPPWRNIAFGALAAWGALNASVNGIEKSLEDLAHVATGLVALAGIHSTDNAEVKTGSPLVSEYLAPFSVPGTAYGGPAGPITSKPNFADGVWHSPEPAKKMKAAPGNRGAVITPTPSVIDSILHFFCPWLPLPDDAGKKLI